MRQKRYNRWLLVLLSAVALLSFPSSVSADFISTGAQIIEGTRKGAEGVLGATQLPEAASGMVQGAKSAYQNFTSTVSGWLGGDKKDTAQVATGFRY